MDKNGFIREYAEARGGISELKEEEKKALVEFSAGDYLRMRDSVARAIRVPLQTMLASTDRMKEGKLKPSQVLKICRNQTKVLASALRDLANIDRI